LGGGGAGGGRDREMEEAAPDSLNSGLLGHAR
jgi:hypothetical protein